MEGGMSGRDVFICHAHVDKATHAGPLNEALNMRGISCWVDEAQILPGESIVEKINDGLRSSRFVVVIITDEFLDRNWPQKELNAALSREIRTGEVVVVPLLATDRARYFDRYPLLEDKLFLDWRQGVSSLASHIAAFFPREPAPEWHCSHPQEYVGLIWARLIPGAGNVGRRHTMTLRWGPYIRTVDVTPESQSPISFMHHKTNPDSVILHASVDPPSVLTFGQGQPPDSNFLNIDEGWTRSAGGYWPGHL